MPESKSMFGIENAIRSEEEAYEVFCAQIKRGLEDIQKGSVYSIDEAWKLIDSI